MICCPVTFIDENNVRSKLPTFVAAGPNLLPSVKLTDEDLLCILNKLANIDLTLNSVISELLGGIVEGFGKMSDRLNTAVQPSFSLPGLQRQNQRCPGVPPTSIQGAPPQTQLCSNSIEGRLPILTASLFQQAAVMI